MVRTLAAGSDCSQRRRDLEMASSHICWARWWRHGDTRKGDGELVEARDEREQEAAISPTG